MSLDPSWPISIFQCSPFNSRAQTQNQGKCDPLWDNPNFSETVSQKEIGLQHAIFFTCDKTNRLPFIQSTWLTWIKHVLCVSLFQKIMYDRNVEQKLFILKKLEGCGIHRTYSTNQPGTETSMKVLSEKHLWWHAHPHTWTYHPHLHVLDFNLKIKRPRHHHLLQTHNSALKAGGGSLPSLWSPREWFSVMSRAESPSAEASPFLSSEAPAPAGQQRWTPRLSCCNLGVNQF